MATDKTPAKRTHAVQTPGAPATDKTPAAGTDSLAPDDNPGIGGEAGPSGPELSELESLRQQLEEAHAKLAAQGEQNTADEAVTARMDPRSKNYANTHSTKIDATKLTAPVLALDGWVVPVAPPAVK